MTEDDRHGYREDGRDDSRNDDPTSRRTVHAEERIYRRFNDRLATFLNGIVAVVVVGMVGFGASFVTTSTADRLAIRTELEWLKQQISQVQASTGGLVTSELLNSRIGEMRSKMDDISVTLADVRGELRDHSKAMQNTADAISRSRGHP